MCSQRIITGTLGVNYTNFLLPGEPLSVGYAPDEIHLQFDAPRVVPTASKKQLRAHDIGLPNKANNKKSYEAPQND